MKYLLAIFILFLAAPAWAGDYTLISLVFIFHVVSLAATDQG